MVDALLSFGALALATKDTKVYSADYLDFEAMNAKSRFYEGSGADNHTTGMIDDLMVVFNVPVALASGDSAAFGLQDSADASSWADLATLEPATAAALPAGNYAYAVPKTHRRYVRAFATPASTGTFTAKTVNAYLEPGAAII